jgi:hypothetical protein
MSNLNFAYSSAPTRTVKEIQFGLLSAKESERLSVIDIEYPETMSVPYVEMNDRTLSDFHTGMSSESTRVKKGPTILILVQSIAISSAIHVKRTWPNVLVISESSS